MSASIEESSDYDSDSNEHAQSSSNVAEKIQSLRTRLMTELKIRIKDLRPDDTTTESDTATGTSDTKNTSQIPDEKESVPQTWEQAVFNQNSIDKSNELTHLSNKFIDTTNIDLSRFNTDKNLQQQTQDALNIANKRAFGDLYIKSENINVTKTTVNGKFEVMVPNGDIKTKLFVNEPVLSANVTFVNVNENSDENTSDEKQDHSQTSSLRVFYDSDGFRPIRNMLENTAGVIVNIDNYNINTDNKLNLQLQRRNDDYLKLFKRSSTRLTKNYVCNMHKKGANMSKILFNRSKVIPEFIMRDYNIKQIPKAAQNSCRAYFTGTLVGGKVVPACVSKCYVIDQYSEYVGQGDYADNRLAFPKAVASSFDGVAVDRNTRVTIYEKKNFEGRILWDRTGPAIINNLKQKMYYEGSVDNTWKDADSELVKNFPCEVREWSESDMHEWVDGSLRVISNISDDS